MTHCAVIGAGAWGTALANQLAVNGLPVVLWAREPDVVKTITGRRENARFLPGHQLSPELRATSDLGEAVMDANVITFAPPSHVMRDVTRQLARYAGRDAVMVVASKGIERDTFALMTDVVEQELPDRDVVALSGPSFAAEVADRHPTAIVAASRAPSASELVQQIYSSSELRIYTHDDVVGVELGGSLKNVMAVATGIVEGLGLGFNSRAALITRGLAEMTRLGSAMGAHPTTFAGLAGMGDLVLTCTGALSRNRALGIEIGKGRSLDEALAGLETVAEGVNTTRSAHALAAREGVDMPIVRAVYRTLFEGRPPRESITDLMTRELRAETD